MMNAITIRNLSEEESRVLEALATESGRSIEAEAKRILQAGLADQKVTQDDKTTEPGERLKAGTLLWELGREFGGLDDIDFSRDQTPARGASFE
jgi:plasmid stability protein